MQAVTAKGQTPVSNGVNDICTAINNIELSVYGNYFCGSKLQKDNNSISFGVTGKSYAQNYLVLPNTANLSLFRKIIFTLSVSSHAENYNTVKYGAGVSKIAPSSYNECINSTYFYSPAAIQTNGIAVVKNIELDVSDLDGEYYIFITNYNSYPGFYTTNNIISIELIK